MPSPSPLRAFIDACLADLDAATAPGAPAAIREAIAVARHLQARGVALQTPQERRQQRELERMMADPSDKVTLTELTDQTFRSSRHQRAAEQLTHILDVQGVPRFFSAVDRAMLRGFQSFGAYLPGVSMPMVKDKMRAETANVILPAETELLAKHLVERRDSGVRMNVNFLGEALLGEDDARKRLEKYLAALQLPEIEVMSVKVSTIYSQISGLSRTRATKVLCDRMELLYRAAARARFTRADGTAVPKFVYLDMEEYRDLDITVETFITTLSRPDLTHVAAGIALQAYVPDSFDAQKRITRWAQERVAAGGAPVTIRIVKGANMEMERVEASIMGWRLAPYDRKIDTDANYKRMVEHGLEPAHAAAVRVGIASHNLFDLSYALVLAERRGVVDAVQFEMLEGMANHQRRALCERIDNMLLYAPATSKEDFVNAIGYLIRRLDENTGPENFLRHAFKLEVDSEAWRQLEQGFVDAFEAIETLGEGPRRQQDRRAEASVPARSEDAMATPDLATFEGEPDTDFALPHNVAWAREILDRWRDRCGDEAPTVPVSVAGETLEAPRDRAERHDPSRPGVVASRAYMATEDDLARAIACGRNDPSGWRSRSVEARGRILARVADAIVRRRGDLMGAALAEAGKVISEADPEVSEAVDFVRFYAASARDLEGLDGIDTTPKGLVAVVTPWNFPIAIPCGGVAAALAAGNTVILKPAPQTVLTAHLLAACFWEGGVPREALQVLPCDERAIAARLVASPEVDHVVLTGGTDTALAMLRARPSMRLSAETGGKNATIVTAMADREQAIKHVVQSAFGHAGQKCSATSLLVLEREVYEDAAFRDTLVDAARSMRVGSAWRLDTRVGPLVDAPGRHLERALKELEEGESWALMPQMIDDNPQLWSPAIKWGVRPGSYTHTTEFFGPVLAVMCAASLDEAIDIVNQTGFGLTSGLQTLDARERERFASRIHAGNLYVNRGTTGAIVLRQPFGGYGKSSFGPGLKAGGESYLVQLMRLRDSDGERAIARDALDDPLLEAMRAHVVDAVESATEADHAVLLERFLVALASYVRAHGERFGVDRDPVRLVGQDNIHRHHPVPLMRVRISPDDSVMSVLARVAAAKIAGCRIAVSIWPDAKTPTLDLLAAATERWGATLEFVEETDDELAEAIRLGQSDGVRFDGAARVPTAVRDAAADVGFYVADEPVLSEGRIELLWYLREQSISHDYHRYGNLGRRADEARRPLP